MIRPGHHRPLGTTTWMRFVDWPAAVRPPELGDVAYQQSGPGAGDEDLVRRAYLVVGLEETRTGYRLLVERVEYGTVPAAGYEALWLYHNVPR